MNDEPIITESTRFWRMNGIQGLNIKGTDTNRAISPKHFRQIEADRLELTALIARENIQG